MDIKLLTKIKEGLLNSNCDLVSILRMAHILATNIKDTSFDTWITYELNGYPYDNDVIPDYRTIKGQIKAKNPYGIYIPVIIESESVEEQLTVRRIAESIPQLIAFLSDSSLDVFMKYPKDMQKILNDTLTPDTRFEYVLKIQKPAIVNVIEIVKTKILEWVVLNFDENDTTDIIISRNEEGIRISGDKKIINLQIGNNNTINNNVEIDEGFVNLLKSEAEKELINESNKSDLLDMIDLLNEKLRGNKKQSVLKGILVGIKDFALNVGASLTAALIQSKIGL